MKAIIRKRLVKQPTKYKTPAKICAKYYIERIKAIILEEDAKRKTTKK